MFLGWTFSRYCLKGLTYSFFLNKGIIHQFKFHEKIYRFWKFFKKILICCRKEFRAENFFPFEQKLIKLSSYDWIICPIKGQTFFHFALKLIPFMHIWKHPFGIITNRKLAQSQKSVLKLLIFMTYFREYKMFQRYRLQNWYSGSKTCN